MMSIDNIKLKLLGIEDETVIIDDWLEDTEGNTLIVSLSTKKENQICPECGSTHCNVHDYKIKEIIHSVLTFKKCIIIYKKRRYRCKDCNSVFFEPNSFNFGYNRISDVTLQCILKDLKTTVSYKDIAERYHVTSQTILNYMDKYIDPKRRELPEILCLDEFKNLSFGKGKYACLLLNYQTGEIVDVLPNRRLDYLQYYFNHISYDERKKVKFVVSDMYEGYKHLAESTFPNSTLVIDAFHYIRYVSDAFNKVRRRIQSLFKPSDIQYKKLKKYWKLLSKDSFKLKEYSGKWSFFGNEILSSFDVIQDIKNIHPDIKIAYLQKEEFFSSYRKINFDKAQSYLSSLINSFENTNLPEFIELANTFKNWLPYIRNSFNKDEYGKRMSNGIIEGSNNKIKVIKRVSYGYSDFYHLRNRIMYVFNDNEKPLPIPKKIKIIQQEKKLFYKPRKPYKKENRLIYYSYFER